MNIVVLGHNQAIPTLRSRWEKLAQRHLDSDVTVIPPRVWPHRSYATQEPIYFQNTLEHHGNFHVVPIDVYPHNGRFIYRSFSLHFRHIKPDIIWVYQDPQGFMMQQVLFCRKMFAPWSKVFCCTMTNTPRRLDRVDLRWREAFGQRNITAFSVETEEMIQHLRGEGVTQPIYKIPIVGADEQLWHRRTENGLKRKLNLGEFVVGFVGRHEVAKGVLELIEALEGLDCNWSFLSLGEGPLKDEVEQRLRAACREGSVQVMGYVPHEKAPPYFRCMDVLVLFPKQMGELREQSGLVIMEANLCGVPVIVSDLPGPAEIAGGTGIIVPQANVEKLREQLAFLCGNAQDRHDIAEKAYERALRIYGAKAIADHTYNAFREVLSQI